MAKRSDSGLSRVIAVNKPLGMTSHDVTNRVRRIYGERRVGHTGTLDPLASGVLVVCVGPATRLVPYLQGHGKRYRMGITFGIGTDTDDAEGQITKRAPIPSEVFHEDYAKVRIASMVGKSTQIPPVYSAIKVNGRKSYEAARKGSIIDLEARPFEIYEASLISVADKTGEEGEELVEWVVEMSVSPGTYMRSIARDLGRDLSTCAYVSSLERVRNGVIDVSQCATLDELEADPDCATVDPLCALGLRYAFVREDAQLVECGSPLPAESIALNEPVKIDIYDDVCCTSSVFPSAEPPYDGEVVALIVDGKVKALYEYRQSTHRFAARCVFFRGVERGTAL